MRLQIITKTLFSAFLLMLSVNSLAAGKLLIVGGALGDDTQDVFDAFLSSVPADRPHIAIIPLASSSPQSSPEKFKRALIRYGADEANIRILPLAVTDDKHTALDERQWADNGWNQSLAKSLTDVGGFWFVGGDQMRIVEALLPEAGKPSPVLTALRQQLQQGAVIGGTSAGAAMMSQPMIAAGDSFSALTLASASEYSGTESQEQGNLFLHHGLGFFPYGMIDQHFDRKSRLGRLVRTLADVSHNTGYGVDEDTGMLVDLATHQFTVVGKGNVTVLNRVNGHFSHNPFTAKNIRLSVLSNGDRFDLQQQALVQPAGDLTVGHEYASEPPHQGAGLALANTRLNQLLGYQLVDNAEAEEIRRYNFVENGTGFMYRFRQVDDSRGYWSAANGSVDRYSIDGVMLDIEPVRIEISQDTKVSGGH